jgi:poly(3-hydroxybutyrate) depolymerase
LPLTLAVCGVLVLLTGCAVPQPRGDGTRQLLREPTTGRSYYLYLPKDYVEADDAGRAARKWPTVVTFHGMRPYDVAWRQEKEWEQEADRYGYVVIAPILNSFMFIFGQFPQRDITPTFKRDEEVILAIMDHVFQTTYADPHNVLSTGFSSGGYMAHYMVNRHPDRFSCLAPRQANFAASLLDSSLTTRSVNHPILVMGTEHDVAICKQETREAIKWYEQHGYRNFAWVTVNNLGHERTPDIAADFFARVCGVKPNRPPTVLAQRQAIDGNAAGMALLASDVDLRREEPRALTSEGSASPRPATPPRPTRVARGDAGNGAQPAAKRQGPRRGTPRRGTRAAHSGPALGTPVAISVSSAIGFEPLLVVYSAECPADWYQTAKFRWTLNGESIGDKVNGQRTIALPGDYDLELLVVTKDGGQHRATRQIRVLKSLDRSAARR